MGQRREPADGERWPPAAFSGPEATEPAAPGGPLPVASGRASDPEGRSGLPAEPAETDRSTHSTDLEQCQEVLGYRFSEVGWLERALTHSSDTPRGGISNERLEFLGDAVLGMVVSRWLYDLFPEATEGELTRIKSVVVSRQSLAGVCARLGLGAFIRVGRGLAGRRLPSSILANTFEAVIAAVYLDGGLRRAQGFIRRHLRPVLEQVLRRGRGRNFKSLLQQVVQAQGWPSPQYRVLDVRGPDHAREFEVEALVRGVPYGRGTGRTKRQAEQQAAGEALRTLQREGFQLPE